MKSKFEFTVLKTIIGEKVQVLSADGHAVLTELTVVNVERGQSHGKRFDSFNVDLDGVAEEHCPADNYIFQHPKFGSETLYISPNAIDQYQICVSRIRNEPSV
ncbi:DUF6916 family protein [Vibrio maritimus]